MSKLIKTSLQKRISKSVSAASALLLVAALVFPFIHVSGGNAQNELPIIRQIRVMEADETGLTNPAGIAFSARDNAFHMADLRQASPSRVDLVKLTPLVARAGLAQISAVQNPINMVFDNRFNRLLLLAAQGNQLVEVRSDNSGNLKPSDITRYNVSSWGLQNPQGMAVDGSTGTLYILDAATSRIVQVQPILDGSFEGASLSETNVLSHDFSSLRGIAFEPSSGHFFVSNPTDKKII